MQTPGEVRGLKAKIPKCLLASEIYIAHKRNLALQTDSISLQPTWSTLLENKAKVEREGVWVEAADSAVSLHKGT